MYRQRVGDYYLGRTIGEGNFAKVKYGQHVNSDETVAIKVLDKDMVERANLAPLIKKEISIMRRLQHPNVVDLRHVMSTRTHIYLVLELVTGGELFERVASNGALKEADARPVFHQLLDGVAHCHARGVYHRDLKLENILLTADGQVKLSDFGLGAVKEAAVQHEMLHTVCGTPTYAAPEVLQSNAYSGGAADVWSMGVCLYVMLAGCLPFDERTAGALVRKIATAEYESPPWLTPAAASLLRGMMTPDPSQRLTIAKIMDHKWVDRTVAATQGQQHESPLVVDSGASDYSDTNSSTVQDTIHGIQPDGVPRSKLASQKQVNAFELLGAAMDISSLFDDKSAANNDRRHSVISGCRQLASGSAVLEQPCLVRRATRFTSRAKPQELISVVTQAAKSLGAECTTLHVEDMPSLRITMVSGRGPLSVMLNLAVLVPGLLLAEFSRVRGHTIDFLQFYGALLPEVSTIVERSSNVNASPSPAKLLQVDTYEKSGKERSQESGFSLAHRKSNLSGNATDDEPLRYPPSSQPVVRTAVLDIPTAGTALVAQPCRGSPFALYPDDALQDEDFAADVEQTTLPRPVCGKGIFRSPDEVKPQERGDGHDGSGALEWRSSRAVLAQMSGQLSSQGALLGSDMATSR